MEAATAGSILWQDSRIADLQDDLVARAGIPDVLEGYDPYTSLLLVDESGVLLTFTSSSWGGRNALLALVPQYRMQGKEAFPIVKLSSKPRNNSYGTIEPVFLVTSWAPRSKFANILGPEMIDAPAPSLPAPEPPKRSNSARLPKLSTMKFLGNRRSPDRCHKHRSGNPSQHFMRLSHVRRHGTNRRRADPDRAKKARQET